MLKRVAAALLIFLFGCGRSNPHSLSLTQDSAHYTFHYSSGSQVDPARQEAFHEWAVARLGIDLGRKIDYYRYLDRAQMKSLTGIDGNAWADPASFAVHSIFSWDDHEVVHVMTASIGRPSDFFNEGIAVAFSTDPLNGDLVPHWLGQPVHDYARSLLRQNRVPPLSDIIETAAFRSVPDVDGYAVAGSFLEFLIDRNGTETCKQFFRASNRDDTRSTILATFQRVYGQALTDAEQEWLVFLRQ